MIFTYFCSYSKPSDAEEPVLERFGTHLGPIWSRLGVMLGLSWSQLGAILDSFGIIRAALHCCFKYFGAIQRDPTHKKRSWDYLGAVLDCFGNMLGHVCNVLRYIP